MKVRESTRFDLQSEENIQEMLSHLEKEGYAVIAAVANDEQVLYARDLFWEFMEGMSGSHIKRDDHSTWTRECGWFGNEGTGILRSPEFNHSKFMWKCRTLDRVKLVYKSIWKYSLDEEVSNDLLVSFDGGNAFRPWQVNSAWRTETNWWHVDQNSCKGNYRKGRVCFQGFVTFYDVNESTGGLCLYPKTQYMHDDLCERNNGNTKKNQDFLYLGHNDPLFTEEIEHFIDENTIVKAKLDPIIVAAKAGDMIIWDSRVVHCNAPALKVSRKLSENIEERTPTVELLRLVAYVSMLPRSHLSLDPNASEQKILRRRKEGFIHRQPSSHWSTELLRHCFTSTNSRGEVLSVFGEEILDWRTYDADVLRLVGFTDEEIASKATEDDPPLPVPLSDADKREIKRQTKKKA